MDKLIGFLVLAAIVVAFALGIGWVVWAIWCWVLPQVWPTGPAGLIAPDFWLFIACWFLLSCIGRAIFGGSSTKST